MLDICSATNLIDTDKMKPEFFLYAISKLKDKLDKFITSELTSCGAEGLVLSHGSILMLLFKAGGSLKMKDLTEKVKRTKSTVSELVNKLEDNGYVKRSECTIDGRVCYVSLTQKGRDLEKVVNKISCDLNSQIYKNFSEKEKIDLMHYLERIENNLE